MMYHKPKKETDQIAEQLFVPECGLTLEASLNVPVFVLKSPVFEESDNTGFLLTGNDLAACEVHHPGLPKILSKHVTKHSYLEKCSYVRCGRHFG